MTGAMPGSQISGSHTALAAQPRRASPRAASPPTSSTACCGRSGRSTSSSKPSELGALPERDRALVRDHRRDRAAPARHAAASARPACSSAACRATAPRVEDDPADRRGADPVSRRARPCRRRSVGAAGAGRPPRRALFRPGQRGAAAARARRQGPARRARPGAARHAGLADAALDRALRRGDRARDRGGARPRAGARSHGQEPIRKAGRATLAAACCRPARCARSRRGRSRCLPGYRRGRLVGAGRRRGACRRACSATCAARPSPISAPRPAARPRSWRTPARGSPRSTARRRGSSALRAESGAAASSAPRSSRPTPREWQGGPFDAVLVDAPCSSTGTIRRHPDIPWLKSEADLGQARRPCRPGCSTAPRRCSSRAARWSIAPARWSPRRARTQIAALLARDPALPPRPDPRRRGRRPCRIPHRRRATCAPCRATGPTPSRGWAGSTASTPPGSSE